MCVGLSLYTPYLCSASGFAGSCPVKPYVTGDKVPDIYSSTVQCKQPSELFAGQICIKVI